MKLNKKLSDSLNILYRDLVNNHEDIDMQNSRYIAAKEYIETMFPKLNEQVLEYLAVYMAVYSTGKIEFYPAKGDAVDLLCTYVDKVRLVRYDKNGLILKDEISPNEPSQKGE